jgi:hypothetical protein
VVEFQHPGPNGPAYRIPIVNLSSSGLSFQVDAAEQPELARLEPGASLNGARLRIGDCLIHGDLMVMHVSGGADARSVFGALLYPASDTDLLKLKSVIAGMEVVESD